MDKKEKKKPEEGIEEPVHNGEVEEKDPLEQQVEEFELKYKRALADYQNLQKRVSEEKGEWVRAANKDLLLRLLPVLDTLMMAEKHLQDQGLAVCINQFLDILRTEGVIRIKTEGEMFDPYTMECVTTEKGEEDKVLKELRAGFMLYDKVLRPAQVVVGKE